MMDKVQNDLIPDLKMLVLNVLIASNDDCEARMPCYIEEVNPSIDPIIGIACGVFESRKGTKNTRIFLWGCNCTQDSRSLSVLHTDLVWFKDEYSMLLAWRDWTLIADPDIFIVFEVRSMQRLLRVCEQKHRILPSCSLISMESS